MADDGSGANGSPQAFDLRHHADSTALIDALTRWLVDRLGSDSDPTVTASADDVANGMSSSTLLFDLDWNDSGSTYHESLVARIAPDDGAIRVFPDYDLTTQYVTMRAVAENSTVPVPNLRWIEPTGDVLGQPFFVMDRVTGKVPPDMLPYTFGDNWLFDAQPADRSRLQDSMISVLADLHAIDNAEKRFVELAGDGAPAGYLARHLGRTQDWYAWSVADNGVRSSLVETALARLTDELPADPGPTVLSWGDARIGNVLFDDFTPTAVLDWEMADLGPAELDVTWLCYSHRVFQDLAEGLGAVGLPDFLRIDDVTAAYTRRTGRDVQDPDWHLLYAAVRWACAFLRTGAREARLNATPLPEDGDTLLHNRPSLTQLVEGTFITDPERSP